MISEGAMSTELIIIPTLCLNQYPGLLAVDIKSVIVYNAL